MSGADWQPVADDLYTALRAWADDLGTFTGHYELDKYEIVAVAAMKRYEEARDA